MPNAQNVDAPIVLVGSGRSGTSLVSSLFDLHPDVRFVGETTNLIFEIWSAIDEMVGIVPPLITDGEPIGHQELAARVVRQTFLTCFPDDKLQWMHKPLGVPKAVSERFPSLDQWDEAAEWYWSGLSRAFPGGVFFALLRQPCDVVLSSRAKWGYSEEDLWWSLAYMSHLLRHPRSLVKQAFSYEQLLKEPESETRRIFDYAAVPFDAAVLEAFEVIHAPPPDREPIAGATNSRFGSWEQLDPSSARGEYVRSVIRSFEHFGLPCELPDAFRSLADGSESEAPATVGAEPDEWAIQETGQLQALVDQLKQEINRLHIESAHALVEHQVQAKQAIDDRDAQIRHLAQQLAELGERAGVVRGFLEAHAQQELQLGRALEEPEPQHGRAAPSHRRAQPTRRVGA